MRNEKVHRETDMIGKKVRHDRDGKEAQTRHSNTRVATRGEAPDVHKSTSIELPALALIVSFFLGFFAFLSDGSTLSWADDSFEGAACFRVEKLPKALAALWAADPRVRVDDSEVPPSPSTLGIVGLTGSGTSTSEGARMRTEWALIWYTFTVYQQPHRTMRMTSYLAFP